MMGPRPLERELGLEQGLRAVRIVRGVQGWGLIVGVVPVSEQPPVRRQLIRDTANEPRLLVRGTGLQVRDVDASEDCDFGVGDLVDTEPAVDVAVDRAQGPFWAAAASPARVRCLDR